MSVICGNCGVENADGAVFCKSCGNKLVVMNPLEEKRVLAANLQVEVQELREKAEKMQRETDTKNESITQRIKELQAEKDQLLKELLPGQQA